MEKDNQRIFVKKNKKTVELECFVRDNGNLTCAKDFPTGQVC